MSYNEKKKHFYYKGRSSRTESDIDKNVWYEMVVCGSMCLYSS